jgi:hypothetical protein
MFEERNKKRTPAAVTTGAKPIDANKSSGLKAEEASRQAEEDITEQLFATEVGIDSAALKTEKDYISFAQKVSSVLYEGRGGYNIPSFFTELLRGIGKSSITTTEDIKKIVDTVTVVYNNKVADDKKKEGTGKKKAAAKAKPSIAQTGKASYERNNNPAMVNDLLGDDEDLGADGYGDEYGEETEYKGKVPENAYDFM